MWRINSRDHILWASSLMWGRVISLTIARSPMYSWSIFACLRFWDASSCRWCYHSAWWPESIDSFMLRINLQHIQRKIYSQTGKQMISERGSWTRDYLLLKIKLPCPSFILILFQAWQSSRVCNWSWSQNCQVFLPFVSNEMLHNGQQESFWAKWWLHI